MKFTHFFAALTLVSAQCPILQSRSTASAAHSARAHLYKRDASWSPTYNATMSASEYEDLKSNHIKPLLVKKKGPLLIRLAWHDSGTYNATSGTGGPHAHMRFAPVKDFNADKGLEEIRTTLSEIQGKFPKISHSDLWQFAAAVAVTEASSNKLVMKWRPGRNDARGANDKGPILDGVLPAPTSTPDDIRTSFYRMGLNDKEIVTVLGAHCLGMAHPAVSGFSGPWLTSLTVFNNQFYARLVDNFDTKFVKETNTVYNTTQYNNAQGEMMLPSDVSLINDTIFYGHVKTYAADQNIFFADFAASFQKLQELGLDLKSEYVDTKVNVAMNDTIVLSQKSAGVKNQPSICLMLMVVAVTAIALK